MQKEIQRFLKNAASNVIAGGGYAVLALVLPYFFVRIFRPAEFSLWVLVLQIAAYLNFLNFGVQTAIGRFVSHSLARNRLDECEDVLGAGLQILTILGLLGMILIAAVAFFLPYIFKAMDPALVSPARIMLLWVGGSLALGLPFTAYSGVLFGIQRNDVAAVTALFSKGALAIALIVTAYATHSLVAVAEAYFAANFLGYIATWAAFRVICRTWHPKLFRVTKNVRRELIAYCMSASAWPLALLLVRGLDLTIVGIFDFKDVGAYGVSAGVMSLFLGVFSQIFAPLLQVFTKLYAREDHRSLATALKSSSLLATTSMLMSASWMLLPRHLIFNHWVGKQLAVVAVPIFVVLLFANVIRLAVSPFTIYIFSVGLQKKVYVSPFVEGVTNLLASILLGKEFGAIGVAWGTMVGAVAGLATYYLYNYRRIVSGEPTRLDFFRSNLQTPVLASLPMLGVLVLASLRHLSLLVSLPCLVCATIPSTLIALRTYREVGQLKRVPASAA